MAPSPLRFAYRYWSVIFMAVCIGAVVFLPLVEEKGVLVEPTEADSVVAFLTSIPLIVAVSVTVAGLAWSLGYLGLTSLPDTEVMAMCWHLTNGTWWSCGCDSWSGLFKIMPRMRKLYLILDNKHGINFADQTKVRKGRSDGDAIFPQQSLKTVAVMTNHLLPSAPPLGPSSGLPGTLHSLLSSPYTGLRQPSTCLSPF